MELRYSWSLHVQKLEIRTGHYKAQGQPIKCLDCTDQNVCLAEIMKIINGRALGDRTDKSKSSVLF